MNSKQRKIRKLMVLGLNRKEAEARLIEMTFNDAWDKDRNSELVTTYHSEKLGNVTVPSS